MKCGLNGKHCQVNKWQKAKSQNKELNVCENLGTENL